MSDVLAKKQRRDMLKHALAETSKALAMPMTDDGYFDLLVEYDTAVTADEIKKTVDELLQDGGFVLSREKAQAKTGKRMVRQTGVESAVKDGLNLAQLNAAKQKELVTGLASVIAVRLNTSLRRQENVNLDIRKLASYLEESLDYVIKAKSQTAALRELEQHL